MGPALVVKAYILGHLPTTNNRYLRYRALGTQYLKVRIRLNKNLPSTWPFPPPKTIKRTCAPIATPADLSTHSIDQHHARPPARHRKKLFMVPNQLPSSSEQRSFYFPEAVYTFNLFSQIRGNRDGKLGIGYLIYMEDDKNTLGFCFLSWLSSVRVPCAGNWVGRKFVKEVTAIARV